MTKITLHKLFENARRDTGPRVDVADEVLARLGRAVPVVTQHPYRPLIWMLTTSSAIAACIAIAAAVSYQSGADSVNVISDMISWAI